MFAIPNFKFPGFALGRNGNDYRKNLYFLSSLWDDRNTIYLENMLGVKVLADYKRLVAYLYLYENGAKQKNSGFAKIECQNNRTRVKVNIRGISSNISSLKVYFLKREKNSMQGIYLGEAYAKNGVCEFQAVTMTNDLGGTGVTFDEIGGLMLFLNSKIAYATEWDNIPINIAKFVEYPQKGLQAAETEPVSEKEEVKKESTILYSRPEGIETLPESSEMQRVQKRQEAEEVQKSQKLKAAEEVQNLYEGEKMQDFLETKVDIAPHEVVEEKEVIPEENTTKLNQKETVEPINSQPNRVRYNNLRRLSKNQRLFYFPQKESNQSFNQQVESKMKEPEPIESMLTDLEQPEYTQTSEEKQSEYRQTMRAGEEQERTETERKEINEPIEEAQRIVDEIVNEESKKHDKIAEENKDMDNRIADFGQNEALHAAEAAESMVENLMQTIEEKEREQEEREQEEREQENSSQPTSASEGEEEIDREALWNAMLSKYKRVHPFIRDESIEYIRIMPRDIQFLPKENWVLSSNSFLLHGYYNYRYLILGLDRADNRLILGVPGVFHNKEKLMASMFGFMDFKPARNVQQKTGEFGYWYRVL